MNSVKELVEGYRVRGQIWRRIENEYVASVWYRVSDNVETPILHHLEAEVCNFVEVYLNEVG